MRPNSGQHLGQMVKWTISMKNIIDCSLRLPSLEGFYYVVLELLRKVFRDSINILKVVKPMENTRHLPMESICQLCYQVKMSSQVLLKGYATPK